MKEEEVLEKALVIINESLNGKIVNPNALQTALQMTQFMWSSVFHERKATLQIELKKDNWEDEINLKSDET